MRKALFLKTWSQDLKWMPYLLRSIEKNVIGFDELVIVYEPDCEEYFKTGDGFHLLNTVPLYVKGYAIPKPNDVDGYIWQQIVKLEAYKYTDCDLIMFIDSDCIFVEPFNPISMLDGANRVIMLKSLYSELPKEVPWQKVTEHYFKHPVEWEYMRRHPMMFYRKTLSGIWSMYPLLVSKILRIRNREFSEFNFMGAFAEKYDGHRYLYRHTAEIDFSSYPNPVRQFWSWGGLTEEVINEINLILA